MARRRSNTIELPIEEKVEVQILPDEAPERVSLVVIEWYASENGDDLDGALEQAAESLSVGGALYFTLPKHLDGAGIVEKLQALFSRIGPLNVGTNPRILNNDVRRRAGYTCLK